MKWAFVIARNFSSEAIQPFLDLENIDSGLLRFARNDMDYP
jgi:hypothetical protein